jgi:hypothetical protein
MGKKILKAYAALLNKLSKYIPKTNARIFIGRKLVEITKIHLQEQYFALKHGEEDNKEVLTDPGGSVAHFCEMCPETQTITNSQLDIMNLADYMKVL